MHSLSIVQQNHSQIFAVSFLNSRPSSNSAILLDDFFDRIRYYLAIHSIWISFRSWRTRIAWKYCVNFIFSTRLSGNDKAVARSIRLCRFSRLHYWSRHGIAGTATGFRPRFLRVFYFVGSFFQGFAISRATGQIRYYSNITCIFL